MRWLWGAVLRLRWSRWFGVGCEALGEEARRESVSRVRRERKAEAGVVRPWASGSSRRWETSVMAASRSRGSKREGERNECLGAKLGLRAAPREAA